MADPPELTDSAEHRLGWALSLLGSVKAFMTPRPEGGYTVHLDQVAGDMIREFIEAEGRR